MIITAALPRPMYPPVPHLILLPMIKGTGEYQKGLMRWQTYILKQEALNASHEQECL